MEAPAPQTVWDITWYCAQCGLLCFGHADVELRHDPRWGTHTAISRCCESVLLIEPPTMKPPAPARPVPPVVIFARPPQPVVRSVAKPAGDSVVFPPYRETNPIPRQPRWTPPPEPICVACGQVRHTLHAIHPEDGTGSLRLCYGCWPLYVAEGARPVEEWSAHSREEVDRRKALDARLIAARDELAGQALYDALEEFNAEVGGAPPPVRKRKVLVGVGG